MLRAAAAGLPFEVPVPQPALDGALIARVTTASGVGARPAAGHLARRASRSTEVATCRAAVLRAHGAMAARIALALDGFDHPALDRALQWDVRHAGAVVDALAPFASTSVAGATSPRRRRRSAAAALDPLAADLRVQAVHQDVTDVNTIARRDRSGRPMPTGLIDFGDLSRTWLAAELAVTIAADAFHALEAPLQAAREVARGLPPAAAPDRAGAGGGLADGGGACRRRGGQRRPAGGARAGQPLRGQRCATRSGPRSRRSRRSRSRSPRQVFRDAAGLAPARVCSPRRHGCGRRSPSSQAVPVLDLSTTSDALPAAGMGDAGPSAAAVAAAGPVSIGRWGEARLADARPGSIERARDRAPRRRRVRAGGDDRRRAGRRRRAPPRRWRRDRRGRLRPGARRGAVRWRGGRASRGRRSRRRGGPCAARRPPGARPRAARRWRRASTRRGALSRRSPMPGRRSVPTLRSSSASRQVLRPPRPTMRPPCSRGGAGSSPTSRSTTTMPRRASSGAGATTSWTRAAAPTSTSSTTSRSWGTPTRRSRRPSGASSPS